MVRQTMSIVIALTIFFFSELNGASAEENQSTFSAFVDDKGTISLPKDFRKTMAHLGSWFVPKGDASGFHDVYTQQADIVAYRASGKFPDGAILIKELRAATTAN